MTEKRIRESQNTISQTSITPSTVEVLEYNKSYYETNSQKDYLSSFILIALGIFIWYFWARDYNKAQKEPTTNRKVYDTPLGCLPWLVAFAFIGLGIYILINS